MSIHVAVRDAFDVAERKLKSHTKQLQAKRQRKRQDIVDSNDDSFDEVG